MQCIAISAKICYSLRDRGRYRKLIKFHFEGDSDMARQSGYEHIYSYVLQGHLNILADERDKKTLLDIVLGIQLTENFKLYAFCITNETVCMLLGGAGKTMINTGIRKVIAGFTAHRVKGNQIPRASRAEETLVVIEKKLLRSEPEIKERCREIHQLPVEKGYVTNIRNYWWSSYRTYLGYYNWSQVDCSVILQMFSTDREAAGKQFRRFHESMPV